MMEGFSVVVNHIRTVGMFDRFGDSCEPIRSASNKYYSIGARGFSRNVPE